MEIKDLEKLKKIADANDDIEKINELLQNMSEFRKKSNALFEKIDKNVIRPAVFGVVDKDYEKVLKAIRNNLTILDYENVNAIKEV